jgi:hypothetical protein
MLQPGFPRHIRCLPARWHICPRRDGSAMGREAEAPSTAAPGPLPGGAITAQANACAVGSVSCSTTLRASSARACQRSGSYGRDWAHDFAAASALRPASVIRSWPHFISSSRAGRVEMGLISGQRVLGRCRAHPPSVLDHRRTSSQSDVRARPALARGPVGRHGQLEVFDLGQVLDDVLPAAESDPW